MLTVNNENIKVFLASTSPDSLKFFYDLIGVLHHANIDVSFVEDDLPLDALNVETMKKLSETQCSIHVIGDQYVEHPSLGYSIPEFHYRQALEYSRQNPEFKLFVWRPGFYQNLPADQRQRNFWYSILNNINENVIFTTHDSPIMFVEDIRSVMITEKPMVYEVKDVDIYLIYNEIDEDSALMIKDLLTDVASVEDTSISLSSDVDYNEYVVQQINNSILPVIYFKKASVWASYFIKEIWRKTGGVSSGKTLLFIGDESVEENKDINFDAPNVQTIITSEELIPLEIKVALDKVKNKITA